MHNERWGERKEYKIWNPSNNLEIASLNTKAIKMSKQEGYLNAIKKYLRK